jgi:hypothetical protein
MIRSFLAQSELACNALGDCIESDVLSESRNVTQSPANKETASVINSIEVMTSRVMFVAMME